MNCILHGKFLSVKCILQNHLEAMKTFVYARLPALAKVEKKPHKTNQPNKNKIKKSN